MDILRDHKQLNDDEILIYLRHSFSYIFFNPLFSEKQPLTRFVGGLFNVLILFK